MLSWIRGKFGPVMVSLIIGTIALVFIFSGVFNPKSTRGLHPGAVAGKVNGESISLSEFNRELNRRAEYFKQMSGGKLTEEQMKAFRLREAVFQELVNRKLMVQEAQRSGVVAGDEEVRTTIRELPVFQKDGKFDSLTYKQVLGGNQLSPSSYERLVREDLAVQHWSRFFKDRARVSDPELKSEFLLSQDKRNIKYVLLDGKVGKKVAAGSAPEKPEEIRKFNEALAEKVLGVMTADKASDAKVNALLKPYGATVKSTGLVTRQTPYLPGLGEAKDVLADAFAAKSPINPRQGGKAKKYTVMSWVVVAVVSEAQEPELAKLETEREKLMSQLKMKKERALQDEWLKKLSSKASIEPNPSVVSSGTSGAES